MRQRLLLLVLVVTTLTLGTILALFGVVVRNALQSSWQSRASDQAQIVAAAVAGYSSAGHTVTRPELARLARPGSELRARLADGQVVETGEVSASDFFLGHATVNGIQVTAGIPRAEANARFREVMIIVVGCGALAFCVGMGGAWWYSRRLTDPLLQFAQAAERLATGDRRTSTQRYGIAELDAVAEVLDRSVVNFGEVLEAERQLTVDASHQLRTPLTALSLRLEEIIATDDLEAAHQEASSALEQVERLALVSDHLVAVARGVRPHVVLPFDIDRLLVAQQLEWHPVFASAGRTVRVDGEVGLIAVGQVGAQAQVVATLLENSLRHGAGTTTLSARTASGWVVIEVRDEGTGIGSDIAPRVFERGVTAGPAMGSGLGLALARTLASADYGRLELLTARPPVFGLFLPAAVDPDAGGDGSVTSAGG